MYSFGDMKTEGQTNNPDCIGLPLPIYGGGTIHKKVRLFSYIFHVDLFIYLGFYVAFNTVQVISRRVVGRAEETST